ncbi:MAG: tetratricopeptide repeat protein [Trichlorobacter sp.]|uniref:tetratricopeptide repeat protein n=1 Tax=Trichlorobacter sp. TaxID=2911007 RepID=UPI0025649751|nr:tetratricopeptide repeat protein [Trichlorobacter sp.]MDK9719124.1 tetratricopeptide repeat protein [Trichlorobacter sp.]
MSILANLLKKNDPHQETGQIPPGLLQTVSSTASGKNSRRTYLVIGAVAVAAIVGGGLLMVYLQTRISTSPTLTRPVLPPQPQMAVKAVDAPMPQAPVSSSRAVAAAVVAAVKPKVTGIRQTSEKGGASARHLQASGAKHAAVSPAPRETTAVERKAVVKDRSSLDAYLFAARSAEARRDYGQAMQQYRKALDVDPHNYRILNNLASTCLSMGMFDEALGFANRALQLKGDYVSALVNGGIAQGKLGNENGARSMLGRAVAVDPVNRSALYNLALVQERSALLDDALNSYRRLSDIGDAHGMLGMARIRERRGENQDALRLYREVTALPDAGQRVREAARERISVLDR